MPHAYTSFPPNLQQWALEQPMFCTASAPLRGRHINLSPKGLPSTTFAVLDENHAAYLDLAASGAETISHIYENGRVTVMFCSFGPKPRILRLYCTGSVIEYDDAKFHPMIKRMGLEYITGVRAVVMLDIWKVFTSCGYAAPKLNDPELHEKHTIENANNEMGETGQLSNLPCKCYNDRHMLEEWLVNKTNKKALDGYLAFWNSRSVDGLPALRAARVINGERLWVGDVKAWIAKTFDYPEAILLGTVFGIVLSAISPTMSQVVFRALAAVGTLLAPVLALMLEAVRILVLKTCLLLKIVILHGDLYIEKLVFTLAALKS